MNFCCPVVTQTRLHSATKLKNIIQDAKEDFVESDVQSGMQPLKDLLTKTIDHLHNVVGTQVFLIICRGFWDRMGQVGYIENIFTIFWILVFYILMDFYSLC